VHLCEVRRSSGLHRIAGAVFSACLEAVIPRKWRSRNMVQGFVPQTGLKLQLVGSMPCFRICQQRSFLHVWSAPSSQVSCSKLHGSVRDAAAAAVCLG